MEQGTKRKASDDHEAHGARADADDKRVKTKRHWKANKHNNRGAITAKAIQPGDSGIFATCNKGQERRCVGELHSLFREFAKELYGDSLGTGQGDDDGHADSIENEIQAEVADMKDSKAMQLFTHVKLDVQCVVFFKTIAPVEPVSFVQKLCQRAMDNPQRRDTRVTKKLAPMTLMARASYDTLDDVVLEVLKPHFHEPPVEPRTFAVRPNLRNHNVLQKSKIQTAIAHLVRSPHIVNLSDPELQIMFEVYQNICGVSVIDDREFRRLKRFNLDEIFNPTPADMTEQVKKKMADPRNPAAAPSIRTELSQDSAAGSTTASMDTS